MRNIEKYIFLSALTLTVVFMPGCASIERRDATRAAVDANLIEGLSSSTKYSAKIWQFPGQPWGRVYSDVGGIETVITDGPLNGRLVVFFVGKSRVSHKWEVFASQIWGDGKWELMPIKLPK